MNVGDRRITSLYRSLSPNALAGVTVTSWREGRPASRVMVSHLGERNFETYRDLVVRAQRLNVRLPTVLALLAADARTLRFQLLLFVVSVMRAEELRAVGEYIAFATDEPVSVAEAAAGAKAEWGGAVQVIEDEAVVAFRRRLREGVRRRLQQVFYDDDAHHVNDPAAAARESFFAGAARTWSELRAIATVADELAADLCGADPLMPELRRELETVAAEVAELNAGACEATHEELELPEPTDQVVAEVRRALYAATPRGA